LFGIIGFVLYLIIAYKDRIIAGHVSTGYTTFTNITLTMVLLQVYLVYNNINSEKFETSQKLSKITTSLLYLYGVITSISAITLFTILKHFSADGFSTLSSTF
jgi:prepilin signal peptidase PulO-like enzyme (type II secretory pathway)